jgi:Fe-S cluster assembly scaffold protein SufB
MLFYLRSRGLEKEQATGILIYGFVREVLDRIDNDSIRKRLAKHVLQGLPGGDNLGETDDE